MKERKVPFVESFEEHHHYMDIG